VFVFGLLAVFAGNLGVFFIGEGGGGMGAKIVLG